MFVLFSFKLWNSEFDFIVVIYCFRKIFIVVVIFVYCISFFNIFGVVYSNRWNGGWRWFVCFKSKIKNDGKIRDKIL